MPVREVSDDPSAVQGRPHKRGTLPCGSRVCLQCHKGCGVIMAAYLSGLDEEQETGGEGE